MRKLVLGLLGAAALTAATSANATATITFPDSPTGIPDVNDFQGPLNTDYGVVNLVTTGSDIVLTEDSILTFWYLGSESGFDDSFAANGVTGEENNSSHFPGGMLLGSANFNAGSLVGQLLFSTLNPQGLNATVGDGGFGIFLPEGFQSGSSVGEFLIGYDDQINQADDNHDDFIIRVLVTPAVPEPATWGMMLLGFGAVGFAMRRRRTPALAQVA